MFFCEEVCNFIKKETLAQVFSCEFCEISKNTFSYRTPVVASENAFTYQKLIPIGRLEQTSCLLKSDLNIINFPVLF